MDSLHTTKAIAAIGWMVAAWLAWKLRGMPARLGKALLDVELRTDDARFWKNDADFQRSQVFRLRNKTPARGANGRFVKRG